MHERAIQAAFQQYALSQGVTDFELNEFGGYKNFVTQGKFDYWLACYQHLAPMVEDAERYRILRSQDSPDLNVQYWDGEFWQENGGDDLDKAVDFAREQEKKTC